MNGSVECVDTAIAVRRGAVEYMQVKTFTKNKPVSPEQTKHLPVPPFGAKFESTNASEQGDGFESFARLQRQACATQSKIHNSSESVCVLLPSVEKNRKVGRQ